MDHQGRRAPPAVGLRNLQRSAAATAEVAESPGRSGASWRQGSVCCEIPGVGLVSLGDAEIYLDHLGSTENLLLLGSTVILIAAVSMFILSPYW